MRLLAKVCGLVQAGDAAQAAAMGADLLGFVWHPPSPRHCADLTAAAPYLSRAVLVIVAEEAEAILAIARRHGFRRVQPYLPVAGRAAGVALLRAAGLFVLLPWADEPHPEAPAADLYLWEASLTQTGVHGGSGQGHNMAFPPPGTFLLAGGLDATNLTEHLAALPATVQGQLRGADAASRLESAPGRKDPVKVSAFISTVHEREFV